MARGLVSIVVALALAVGALPPPPASADVPRPAACDGGATLSQPVPGPGATITLSAYASCGTHWLTFSGSTVSTTAGDICSDSTAQLVFAGDETVDYGAPQPGTWALAGSDGVYTITGDGFPGGQQLGALITTTSPCDPLDDSGPLVLALPSATGPAPAVLVCHADGAVGDLSVSAGRAGYTVTGTAQGSGTCASPQGTSQVQLVGQWSESGTSTDTTCPAGQYSFPSVDQDWAQLAGGAQAMTVVSPTTGAPIGAGRVQQTPDPCPGPASPFQFTADWAFTQ